MSSNWVIIDIIRLWIVTHYILQIVPTLISDSLLQERANQWLSRLFFILKFAMAVVPYSYWDIGETTVITSKLDVFTLTLVYLATLFLLRQKSKIVVLVIVLAFKYLLNVLGLVGHFSLILWWNAWFGGLLILTAKGHASHLM